MVVPPRILCSKRQRTEIKLTGGGAGTTGATGYGGEGHRTATSGDERRAVAVTMAADQVEAEESLMVVKRVWPVVSCIVGVQTYSSLIRLSSLTNSEIRGVLFVFSN